MPTDGRNCPVWSVPQSLTTIICNTWNIQHDSINQSGHTHEWLPTKVIVFCCESMFQIIYLRAGLHHGPWSRTMEDEIFPWSDLMVQFPWYHFLQNQFTKLLGPSFGANRICIKRNGHAPKSDCANIFKLCPKRAVLEKIIKYDYSLVFSCLRLNSSKKDR